MSAKYGSDIRGDEYTVKSGQQYVHLWVEDDEDVIHHIYTVDKARLLAQRLMSAANEVEGEYT